MMRFARGGHRAGAEKTSLCSAAVRCLSYPTHSIEITLFSETGC